MSRGFHDEWRVLRMVGSGVLLEHFLFAPETEAADAVLAAEKYGLFACGNADMSQSMADNGDQKWVIKAYRYGVLILIGSGTFCEAICQAIICLEEQRKGTEAHG